MMDRAEKCRAQAIEVIAMFEGTVLEVRYLDGARRGWLTRAILGSAVVAALLILFRNGSVLLHHPASAWSPASGALFLYGLCALAYGLYRVTDERRRQTYTIGSHPRANFPLADAALPTTRFPLIRAHGTAPVLQLAKSFSGEMELDGECLALAQLRQSDLVRPKPAPGTAFSLIMPPRAHFVIRQGAVSFLIQAVARPPRHALAPALDYQALGCHVGVLLAALGFLALLFAVPPDPRALGRARPTPQLTSIPAAVAKLRDSQPVIHIALQPPALPHATASRQPERFGLAPSGRRASGAAGAPSRGSPLRAPATSAHSVGPPVLTVTQRAAIIAAQRSAILGMFRSSQSPLTVLTPASPESVLGTAAEDALQQVGAPGTGSADSQGELALVGSGRGPGSTAEGSIASREIGRPFGLIGGGASCDEGDCLDDSQRNPSKGGSGGRLGRLGRHAASIPSDLELVSCGMRNRTDDFSQTYVCILNPGKPGKDNIRRVVHSHINEVKFCYEQQLVRNPELQGRVTVGFTIAAPGQVTRSVVKESTLNDSAVEQCIVSAVQRWEFSPSPSGLTEVTYPFVLLPSED